LIFNLLSVITLFPILVLPALLPDIDLYSILYPWFVLTVIFQGLAILILVVGLLQTGVWRFLGVRQLVNPSADDQAVMVVHGFYRWVRHPLYTAGFFIWLVPVMTLNVLALNMGLSLYLIMGASVEERKLAIKFGQPYILYRNHTPKLFPVRIPGTIFKDRV
jgi:protein-S-isoprenylcysteine O-methyltransferase Ste14